MAIAEINRKVVHTKSRVPSNTAETTLDKTSKIAENSLIFATR
jgi:hypothetical protein